MSLLVSFLCHKVFHEVNHFSNKWNIFCDRLWGVESTPICVSVCLCGSILHSGLLNRWIGSSRKACYIYAWSEIIPLCLSIKSYTSPKHCCLHKLALFHHWSSWEHCVCSTQRMRIIERAANSALCGGRSVSAINGLFVK